MNKPLRSRYNNTEFAIQYVPGLLEEDAGGAYGMTMAKEKRIKVDSDLTGFDLTDTLIHEVLHQLWLKSAIPTDDEEEERIVNYLGTALASHMKDNPGFWRFCVSEAKK